ncbi:hypothetical protein AVEN_175547-1 [Araneus ventricosus]|uniref:Uncharacterized protein n=1 Tax=Araneus ventricosus TaxID=182803 RepID=A0A4Y2CNF7_ARAVE|nr:hypothetical protein AVEN_175547-1 [Araneus ventricosus]
MTRALSELAPLQISALHQRWVVSRPASDLTCNRPTYTENLQWNRVSNSETSDPEAVNLPLGYRCLEGTINIKLCVRGLTEIKHNQYSRPTDWLSTVGSFK